MDKEIVKIEDIIDEGQEAEDTNQKKFNLTKLFSNKNLKIIILVIIFIIALILFMGVGNKSNESKLQTTNSNAYEYISTVNYCSQLETKLEKVLSQIKGAGQVSVMVSVDGSPELIYALDSDTKVSNTSNGSTTTSSSTPIIIQTNGSSNPLILSESLPEVKGVIVVSSGANDIAIKLDILNAISTLLDISTEKISVLKGI